MEICRAWRLAYAVPLGYKWVRINMKTNRIAAPYFVDQTGDPTTLDTRVCWDGKTEQLSPGGANPKCDANGMLPVYMLTSLAMAQGTRNLARAEVVGPSIRPAWRNHHGSCQFNQRQSQFLQLLSLP